MNYEREYLPRDEELEDVVRVLKGGASEALDVPDDAEEPTEEGAPTGATRGEDTAYRSPVAATAEPGQPTEEEEYADYD